MSAAVLPFVRPAPKAPKPQAAFPETPHFYCQSCDCEEFRIYGSAVYCAKCKALIRNLFAMLAKEPA